MLNLPRKRVRPDQHARQPRVSRQAAPVFSYYNNRSARPESPARDPVKRQLPKSIRDRLREIPTIMSIVVIVIATVYATTLSSDPKIDIVTNAAQFGQPEQIYHDKSAAILRASLYNYSKLTINSDAVASEIESSFPEVREATLSLPFLGRRPVVTLTIEAPVMILKASNGSYYIRSDGVAIVDSDKIASELPDLVHVNDASGLNVTPGKAVLTKDTTKFIRDAFLQLKAGDLVVESATLPVSPNELDVKIQGKPYTIRFNTLGDARLQVGALRALMKQFSQEGGEAKAYIDLRVEERIFYK